MKLDYSPHMYAHNVHTCWHVCTGQSQKSVAISKCHHCLLSWCSRKRLVRVHSYKIAHNHPQSFFMTKIAATSCIGACLWLMCLWCTANTYDMRVQPGTTVVLCVSEYRKSVSKRRCFAQSWVNHGCPFMQKARTYMYMYTRWKNWRYLNAVILTKNPIHVRYQRGFSVFT